MKKSLLSIAAVCASASIFAASPVAMSDFAPLSGFQKAHFTAVDEERENGPQKAEDATKSMIFSYAYGGDYIYTIGGESANNGIYIAFEIPVEDQQSMIGAKITQIKVCSGQNSSGANSITKAVGFVTEDLYGDANSTASITLSTNPGRVSTTAFTQPYVITGEKPIYIGYKFAYVKGMYYLITDGRQTGNNTCLYARTTKITDTPTKYQNLAPNTGSAFIQVKLEGENLPENWLRLGDVEIDGYQTGNKIAYDINVKNCGSNDIETVDILTTTNCGTNYSRKITLDAPIKAGNSGVVNVTNVPNQVEGVYMLNASVSKINSVNPWKLSDIDACYSFYKEGYPRKLVMEEATGSWCGWCPAGIVSFDYMKANYPDDIIPIAVHYGDVMQLAGYDGFINNYISGFPTIVCNRAASFNPTANAQKVVNDLVNYYKSYPSYAKVNVWGECDDAENNVKITATTEFSTPIAVGHKLFFVLLEDGVGPYNQANNYANGKNGVMGGWEKRGSSVEWYYNEVPKVVSEYPGVTGSIPAEPAVDTPLEFEIQLPVTSINNRFFTVVGMVVNDFTGEIINASHLYVGKSGIEGVAEDLTEVTVSNGSINVSGASQINVYTLDGRNVGNDNLAKGIYVVRADGKTFKVFVK